MKRFQLPFGVQDYLPNECYNKNIVEKHLSEVFYNFGYERVETPALEYYDLFNNAVDESNINKMFKLSDTDGSLLVLRPDTTLQICRLAATKLNLSETNRLYYIENSFEYLPNSSSARTREFAQAGVELIGKTELEGDLEIIILAIQGLKKCGLENFLIEIGQVEFFKGLMLESGLDFEQTKTLTALINNKDMLGMEMFFKGKNLDKQFISKFLLLPTLFGDVKVLEKAKKICNNALSLKALNHLDELLSKLKDLGLSKYVSIDLGLVQNVNYYSGVVIRGVSNNLGLSLLDGGRYDTLLNSFNTKADAIGFAIGIKRLLIALENQSKLSELKSCDIAYYATHSTAKTEYEFVEKYRNDDFRVVKCFFDNESDLQQYCITHNIQKAFAMENNQIKEVKLEKKKCSK